MEPLTSEPSRLLVFLNKIRAEGGGDFPEAVDDGLEMAIQKNAFRPAARKAVLLFGDAPPHANRVMRCLELAQGFHQGQHGFISTITCQSPWSLKEFQEIARTGGGEAHVLSKPEMLMEDIVVAIFGERHRKDVFKFFDLSAPSSGSPALKRPLLRTRVRE